MDAVIVDNLTKDYGRTRALDSATWTLPPGRLLGFLGPNGAGKTTNIRILLGFMKATSGRAVVLGMDAWQESARVHRRVGYLPGDIRLYPHLTGDQTIRFIAGARGMTELAEPRRLADVLQLDLATTVRSYSKGMRQKLGLILGLMHRPELLILDEPTAGLDPIMQHLLYAELRAAPAEGRTVLFSSHSLPEVEALCDSVVVLRAGRVVACKPVETLRREACQRVRLKLTGDTQRPARHPDGFTIDKCHDGALEGRWHGHSRILLEWLATLPVEEVIIQPPDLEDVFLAYYGREGGQES